MLSVAHHPETPGSASKHSSIGHAWSDSKVTTLKRRRVESDSIVDKKKTLNGVSNLTEKFNLSEITLTLIPKTKSRSLDLVSSAETKTKESNEKQILNHYLSDNNKTIEKKDIPSKFLSLIKNYDEIELTKVESTQNSKTASLTNSSNEDCSEQKVSSKKGDDSEGNIPEYKNSNSNLTELTEITIEPCANSQKIKAENSSKISSNSSSPKVSQSESRLAKAGEILRKQKRGSSKNESFSSDCEVAVYKTDTKKDLGDNHVYRKRFKSESEYKLDSSIVKKKNPNSSTHQGNSSLKDEDLENVPATELQSVPVPSDSNFQDFSNVGEPWKQHYKTKPSHCIGFPNPPFENRCWANATFQVLFALPPIENINKLGNLTNDNKLLNYLINIQSIWRNGAERDHTFDTHFNSFKAEVSKLDQRYESTEQQDVTEFLFLLLNTLKLELGNKASNQSSNNEIENIPNNEQDTLPRTQNSPQDSNKRLPLTEISAITRPVRNVITYGSQDTSVKNSPSPSKSKNENQTEINSNPIDDFFSFSEEEHYTCEGCSKERVNVVNENLTMFVDLPSEDNGSIINLSDLITASYAAETRDLTCESCKHEVQKMEKKIKKPPKILIASIKRYKYTENGHGKSNTLIEIPRILQLDSLIVNNTEIDHYPKYEPIGIISHIGDEPCRGHYVSCVKHESKWIHYDDLNVKVLTDEEVFKCSRDNSYLIFFKDPSQCNDTSDELTSK